MTKQEIAKLAKQLYKDVLEEYKNNPGMTMTEILNKHLAKYNDKVAGDILQSIYDIMAQGMTAGMGAGAATFGAGAAIGTGMIGELELSTMLYNNAKETAKAAKKVIDEHLRNQATINDLREALYDGYGYDELLDIKKSLPKYLAKDLTEAKLAKLKTKQLKAAYLAILDAKNDKQLAKAMKNALEARARYYAWRIAYTEQQKAYLRNEIAEMINNGVEFVRWTLSPRHSIPCICDYYANKNIGYGRGVFPLNKSPVPTYSSHPFCACVLSPVKHRTHRPQWNTKPPKRPPGFPEVKVEDLF